MRAAAFEKRIKKVIAFGVYYDLLEGANSFIRNLVVKMMKWEKLMNLSIRMRMKAFPFLRHIVNHCLFINGNEDKAPIEAARWILKMNKIHIHSELVTQDVFLMTGENDKFQPPKLLKKQIAALKNAKSVTGRIFTKKEHADNHCQMGNINLAVQTVVEWLNR